jgi:hypothetical protein
MDVPHPRRWDDKYGGGSTEAARVPGKHARNFPARFHYSIHIGETLCHLIVTLRKSVPCTVGLHRSAKAHPFILPASTQFLTPASGQIVTGQ